jgi:hypothetical protein
MSRTHHIITFYFLFAAFIIAMPLFHHMYDAEMDRLVVVSLRPRALIDAFEAEHSPMGSEDEMGVTMTLSGRQPVLMKASPVHLVPNQDFYKPRGALLLDQLLGNGWNGK